jgi:branched-chain amino acid transport system substrate-binding protein
MKLNTKSWVTVLLVSMFLLATISPMAFGAEKKVVKIGFIGPLTGPNAAVGLGARNSADLVIKQANEKGTYPYKLELVVTCPPAMPGA